MERPERPTETVTETVTDAQIVRRVLMGEIEAFALLVDRHHARSLRVATHLLGDGDDAEDAVQEAFVRAYRHLGSYRERDRFGSWLSRIVVNQCRSMAAKHRRFVGPGDSATAETALQYDDDADALERAARRQELALALSKLGPAQREALVLRFSDELSYDEMAHVTGVGVSALKMRVQRACAQLRALLSEHLHA